MREQGDGADAGSGQIPERHVVRRDYAQHAVILGGRDHVLNEGEVGIAQHVGGRIGVAHPDP
ncbi:MAG: hypothetical protein ACK53I_06210 [Phenylobacterium sp.]